MTTIRRIRRDSLPAAPGTPGLTRHLAADGEGFRILRAVTQPGITSGWHHHGNYDIYGYVVSGAVRFESGTDGQVVTNLQTGDFFVVPAHVVHRDVNPSDTRGQEVVLFLMGEGGPMVINVDGPPSA